MGDGRSSESSVVQFLNGRGQWPTGLRRAVVSLAVVGSFAFGSAQADAALNNRDGDPVVLKGAALPGLIGKSPADVVAFKFDGGWQQVPVQIDERKTISVSSLYPDKPLPPYVISKDLTFNVEVYTDEKTRTGPDTDLTFDADDELVFMGKDSGVQVPAGSQATPDGVIDGPGVEVKATDSIDGGTGYVYLFRSAGSLDPAAGKEYVDYDFKLTNLIPGRTIANGYGYLNTSNPEDSSVKTPFYTLHSTDRWMEDGLEIHAGSSTGADILDREVAQATLTSCGRSQYTFSGNWTDGSVTRGGDTDEGTYVTIKSGPVRAIRSFMGANSGPYVQKEHIYYERREDSQIFLRVHPMTDLYSWTDYSESAIGMTYRNFKNEAGVTVDGAPDTLTPATNSDFAPGMVAWEQLSGPQGSVSTVTSASTDMNPSDFGSYYLDDSTPTANVERQCGGDGKSFGASGFGIGLNTKSTPNTDPRYGQESTPAKNLTVNRVRYFDTPDAGAAEAARDAAQVKQPLAASVAAFTPGAGKGILTVKMSRKSFRVKPGRKATVSLKITNRGDGATGRLKVCASGPKKKLGGLACRSRGSIARGGSATARLKIKVQPGAKKGKTLKVRIVVKGTGLKTVGGTVNIKVG